MKSLLEASMRVVDAIKNAGGNPEYHMGVMKRSKESWEYLWDRLDDLVKVVEDLNSVKYKLTDVWPNHLRGVVLDGYNENTLFSSSDGDVAKKLTVSKQFIKDNPHLFEAITPECKCQCQYSVSHVEYLKEKIEDQEHLLAILSETQEAFEDKYPKLEFNPPWIKAYEEYKEKYKKW